MAKVIPDLDEVHPLRIYASRLTDDEITFEPSPVEPFTPTMAFEFSFNHESDRFGVKMGVTAETSLGEFDVQLFGIFDAPGHTGLPDEEMEVVLREAMRLLFPFLRAEIMDITGRVFSNRIMAPLIDFSNAKVKFDFRNREEHGSD